MRIFLLTLTLVMAECYAHAQQVVHSQTECERFVAHRYYMLSFDTTLQQARWVSYTLKAYHGDKEERSNSFKVDPLLARWTNHAGIYAKSGYDRGHLAPAADFVFSDTAMQETFLYSNMSPQFPVFNRGIWKKVETTVRAWADDFDSLWIVTGPVWQSDSLAASFQLPVASHFYKVVVCFRDSSYSVGGFLVPHAASQQPSTNYLVSVNEIEALTGIDFFLQLSSQSHENAEAKVFDWQPFLGYSQQTSNAQPTSKGIQESGKTKQCGGTTLQGKRCLNKTKNTSGFCHLHEK